MISHKHQCIFIHIPKTGGTSIEDAFCRSLGISFKNGLSAPLLISLNTNKSLGPPSLSHLLPEEYLKYSYISEDLFKQYFKFAFVRNPYARVVSFYKYFHYNRMMDFSTFLREIFPLLQQERWYFVRPQVDYLFDEQGKILVDFIGKFESLEEDFESIRPSFIPEVPHIRHLNDSNVKFKRFSKSNIKLIRKKLRKEPILWPHLRLKKPLKLKYEDYYTEEDKKIVHDIYQLDFDNLNYNSEF